MDEAKPNLPYDIEIIDFDGEVGIAVEFDGEDDATAINWAYYYLGKYRGDKARISRGHTNPRDPSTLVAEISSADDARRRAKSRRKEFGIPGRCIVSVECADDLTDDEIIMMEAWFEAKVSLLQKKTRGYTDEQAFLWECEALGIDPATQRVA
jgi:hypothetical protein